MQHKLATIFKILFLAASTFLASPGHAQDKIGVLMLHGKNPGSSQDPNFSKIKPTFEKSGMLVLLPDMPWSRSRYIDGNWDKAMAEITAHVKDLRSRGATRVVVVGHSIGVTAAMSFAARGGDVQALVLLSPGHVPKGYYNSQNNKVVRESVDEARALVAAGKGDSRERFNDINQGRQMTVVATAKDYLSYFDPESDAEMGMTAPRIPVGTPVLTVVGDEDSMFTRAKAYFADKLPANPKSQYLEVKGNHLSTPAVASEALMAWIKAVL